MRVAQVTGVLRRVSVRTATLVLLTLGLVAGVAHVVDHSAVLHARQAPQAPAAPAAPSAPDTPRVPAPVPPEAPEAPAAPFGSDFDDDYERHASSWTRPVVRIGQDHAVRAGDRVREVVVVFGSATIDGRVDRDVVVVLGTLRLAATADVGGSVVVAAGNAMVAPGARVGRDVVIAGGGIDAPDSFSPGQEYVVIGLPGLSGHVEATVPWFTRGLLWGRLIVPNLGWMWVIVATIVGVYLVLNLLFKRPVMLCRDVIAQRPFSAFLTGLLVLVLIGPVFFILAVSVIGIPVIPFVLCGLFVAMLLGKIGLTRWVGSAIWAEDEPGNQIESLRSFLIGTAVILFAYMVPVLGVLVWAIGSVFGLGAATLAFSSGLRRESARKPRPMPPVSPAPVVEPAPAGAFHEAMPAQPLNVSDAGGSYEAGPAVVPPSPMLSGAAVQAGAGLLVSMPKAPFLDRLAAFALDVLLVSLTFNLLDMDSARAFFTLLLAYHIVFWAMKATTVGGIICNLRVVRTDGMPLLFPDALIRGMSSILSIAALGIGCFWILFDRDNQAWHDRLAGTYVVKVPKGWTV